MTSRDIFRRNRARGVILKILAPSHPNGLDQIMIRRELQLFGHAVDRSALRSYIEYLVEAGCVKKTTLDNHGIDIITITNRGLNILDSIAPDTDPGIDVEGL